ncbi:MAG TPA: plastocyanin/azurin family copper-binding protein [Anaerolineaceae bacterium]|nr:plastocyanin/azurin family copper-binding protein [Anaerolineaceae bacterium]
MRKFSVIMVLALVLTVVLSACGGGGSSSGGTSNNIKTTMSDFKFDPAEWTVPAGQTISLTIDNKGSVKHDWVLMMQPVTPPLADENAGQQIAKFSLDPGASQTVTFTSPSNPGDYEVVCTVPGHLDAGMKGTLHVK